MNRGSFDRRPGWGAVMVAVALMGLPLPAAFAPDASAALICQKKKKVHLRADACKKKETLVQDLAQLGNDVQALGTEVDQLGGAVGMQGGQIGMQTARIDQLVLDTQQLGNGVQQLNGSVQQLNTALGMQAGLIGMQTARVDRLFGDFRLDCVNAPNLVKAESDESFYFDDVECGGGCRTHDGNQAACEAAYADSNDGATSCFFFKNLCLPCADCGEEHDACTNACRVPVTVTCPNDPTRTIFAGGPGTEACEKFDNQADCELAFHADRRLRPATCWWDGSACHGCGARNENDQDCVNTCRTIGCADPTRTVLRQCDDVGNDEVACNQTWHLAGQSGDPASCWYDAVGARCRGCGFPQELPGNCDNTCR